LFIYETKWHPKDNSLPFAEDVETIFFSVYFNVNKVPVSVLICYKELSFAVRATQGMTYLQFVVFAIIEISHEGPL